MKDEVHLFSITPIGLEGRVFERRLEANKTEKAGPTDASDDSVVSAQNHVPLNAVTLPLRNTVREALKALRGDDRVAVLERLRKAWRIQLPSGKPFSGLPKTKAAPKKPRSNSTQAGAGISPNAAGGGKNRRFSLTSQASSGSKRPHFSNGTETASTIIDTAEENDEDVILRVIAQRLAPKADPKQRPVGGPYNLLEVDNASQMFLGSKEASFVSVNDRVLSPELNPTVGSTEFDREMFALSTH